MCIASIELFPYQNIYLSGYLFTYLSNLENECDNNNINNINNNNNNNNNAKMLSISSS